jgi:acetyltransferase-like isoleucine patch superfamily enzyme
MSESKLLIVGQGAILARAAAVAAEAGRETTTFALEGAYEFDLSVLAPFPPEVYEVFVAMDYRALNYIRIKLVGMLTKMGYRLAKLVSPTAILARDLPVAPGVLIEAGAIINAGTTLDLGAIVGAGAKIGIGCKIGRMVWIGQGCNLGSNVRIGAHSTLDMGVTLMDNTELGPDSEIVTPGVYHGNIPRGTFISGTYPDEPVRILTP